jgi:hypothetical protein
MEDSALNVLITMAVGFFAFVSILRLIAKENRQKYLLKKYGDKDIVDAIVKKNIRLGMTKSMVEDSWGSPVDFEESVSTRKKTEILKYNKVGKRYKSKIFLSDGIVEKIEIK